MFGKLLKRFFGGRDRARPVSPPPPPIPPRPIQASVVAPPPPPPTAIAPTPEVPGKDPMAAQIAQSPVHVVADADADADVSDPGRVRFILEDGTIASPTLDAELEERLKYIVDNIVPPSEPPST